MKSWWVARSKNQRIGIIVGAVVVLAMIASAAEEPVDKKPSEKAAASSKTVDPAKKRTLADDVRKNLRDQYGKKAVVDVTCDKQRSCEASVRAGTFRDADDLAREMGGGLHELFRDTDANTIRLQMLSDTVDELGNEDKDDEVGFVLMTRAGWARVDWDNLQYMEPLRGLRDVGTVAVTVRF